MLPLKSPWQLSHSASVLSSAVLDHLLPHLPPSSWQLDRVPLGPQVPAARVSLRTSTANCASVPLGAPPSMCALDGTLVWQVTQSPDGVTSSRVAWKLASCGLPDVMSAEVVACKPEVGSAVRLSPEVWQSRQSRACPSRQSRAATTVWQLLVQV